MSHPSDPRSPKPKTIPKPILKKDQRQPIAQELPKHPLPPKLVKLEKNEQQSVDQKSSNLNQHQKHGKHKKAKPQPFDRHKVFAALTFQVAVIIGIGFALDKFLLVSSSPSSEVISESDIQSHVGEPDQGSDRQLNCKDFKTQKAAQYVLDLDPKDPFNLDGNNNKLACESLEQGTSGEGKEDLNCTDFATKKAAQYVLELNRSDPFNLDANNNNLACETLK